jgi:hypothetical protein
MKKGDLIRYYKHVINYDDCNDIIKELVYEKGIVVKDYEKWQKMVKIILVDGTVKKVHASQVQLHKRTKPLTGSSDSV